MNREVLALMPDADRRDDALMRALIRAHSTPAGLTPRERQVVVALAAGLSRPEVAEVLGITLETVKDKIKHAKPKLGAKSIGQLTANAVRQGVIP